MEADFQIDTLYTVTGDITGDVVITLRNGSTMRVKRFRARVYPAVGADGISRLRIDRHITVMGFKFKSDGTPGSAPGVEHYWLSEESTPMWVRVVADHIEATECPRIATPAPLVFQGETP